MMVQEIVILALEILLLIIKLIVNPEDAIKIKAEMHGVSCSKLWRAVPKRLKNF